MIKHPLLHGFRRLLLFSIPYLLYLINASLAQIITGKPPQFSKFPHNSYSPLEGTEFSIKCPLLYDTYQIEWFKDGESLGKSSLILSIPSISRIDSGIYKCYTYNGIGGAFSPSINISVTYFDGFKQVPESFYKIKVSPSGYFSLKPPPLDASSNSKLTWKWKFEEQEIFTNDTHYISANGDLIILEAARRFGIYRVEVISEKSSAISLEYTVEEEIGDAAPPNFAIVYRPKDILILDDTSTSATFECVPSIWNKFPAEINWLLNGNELTVDGLEIRTEFSNRRLILSNVVNLVGKSNFNSKITCEATTSDERLIEKADAKLEIYEKPIINKEKLEKEVTKKIGDSFKMECKTRQAWPRAKFAWYLNRNKLPNFHKDKLKIERLTQSNFGVYQCEAINQAGSDSAAVWLKTDDGQSEQMDDERKSIESDEIFVVKPPEKLDSEMGKDIVLTCETSNPHKTTLTWTFNGSLIPQNDPHFLKNSTSLLIHAAKKSDSGIYECIANSGSGQEVKATVQVNVTGSKLIEYGPQNPMNQLIGTNVHMPCKVYEDYADRNDIWTVWYRNGQEIPSSGDLQRRITINNDGSLAINQVGPDNIGLYKCTVRISHGDEESATAWLHIIEKPSMPQAVQATIVNNTVPVKIKVSWKPGFDGNSPLLKHSIEMRTLGPTGLWSEWETAYDNVPTEAGYSAMVDNIKPSATAEFRVIAYNKYGAGKASRPSLNITMPQQPPAAAPRNVAASARSSSSVMVQWQQPPPEQWNGDILGYHIRYRLAGYSSAKWNELNISNPHARNALIEPLITWREYEIQVAAYNERGCGVYSKPIEVTTLEGIPMQAPQNVEVRIINSTDIRVSFDPPDQQMIPGVNLGYKIELWKNGQVGVGTPYRSIRVYPDPTRIMEHIGNLEKFGHYNLTVLCFTAPGDGPRSDPMVVVTDEDIPGPLASVTFDMVMFSSVVVIWEEPLEPNGIILKYTIRHWEEANPDEKHSIDVSSLARNHTIENLSASTKYLVDIQAINKKGAGPRVEAKFESGVPPELPGRPSSLAVTDIGPRSAVLQFVPGFDGHSFIKRWIVEARVGSSSIFTTIYNTSAPKARSFIVDGLRPFTKYQLRLIAENVRGRGAPSEPTRPFETRQTEPETPPEKVFAEPTSDNQISLSWTPLMPSQWNGDPSGYLIQFRTARNSDLLNIFDEDQHEWKEIRTPNSKASELTLSDLRPHIDYQIRVFAENTYGRSAPSALISTKTYESVPSGAPTEVFAELDPVTRSLKISWSEIEDRYKNGIILGYFVKVVPEEQNLRQEYSQQIEVIGAKQHSVEIENLRAFTAYRIFVSGFTIVGEGPQNSDPPLLTTPEDLPEEPSDVSFGSVGATEFRIKWTPPINPNGKIKSYDLACWQDDQPKESGMHTTMPYNVFTFLMGTRKPNITHNCAIKAENGVGWGPETVVQVFTSEKISRVPPPNPSRPERNPNRPESSTEIWLHWEGHQVNSNNIALAAPVRFANLQFKKANQNGWTPYEKTIPATKNEAHLKNLIPNMAYKFQIQYQSDFGTSGWSTESDWIKTQGAAPSKPPSRLTASPYETSALLVQWTPPDRLTWGSDSIGYRILYKIYHSNDTYKSEEIPASDKVPVNGRMEHVISKLSSFRHYIVQVQAFNQLGNSASSRPVFVYVGYSIPKQTISGLSAEGLSSTSIRVTWDAWKEKEDDFINGYRIRYAPLLSVLSPEIQAEANGGDSTEEVVISENNEMVLTDLRKYTEYQISVAGYNRAGEGQTSNIRIKTLEDIPGPVGNLIFQDILLDSVNVSWSTPVEPNGRILGYIVNYRTYKLSEDFRKDIQEKTQLNYFLAENLEENTTYFFTVHAQTSAGGGINTTGNITTGYNTGAPEAPERPIVVQEQSTFMLQWRDGDPGFTPIKGHVIQAKRVGTSVNDHLPTFPTYLNDDSTPAIERMKRQLELDFRPRHVIGEWVTISTILGPHSEHKISYRQLEPASYYVFRLFATNTIGIGRPSPESDQLFVPATLPEEPFYTKWWFLVIVGLLILIVVIIFVATLCLTSGNSKYKGEKRGSFDSLQLADGAQVAYELRQSQKTNKMRRSDLPSRPPTHTSWLSAPEPIRNQVDSGGYGSIASGLDAGPSMYRALATDAIPQNSPADSKRNSALETTSNGYASRRNLNLIGGGRSKSPSALKHDFHESSTYRLSDFNANRRLVDENPYGGGSVYDYERSDSYNNERQSPEEDAAESFARHYEFGNANEEIYRATWRRTRAQAEQQQRTPLPPTPGVSKMGAESSITSSETQQNGSEVSEPINAAGILLRSNYSSEISSPSQHPNAPHNIGNSVINGFSSFV